jgi:hypothetical protein
MTTREMQRNFEQSAMFVDKLKDIRIVSQDVQHFLNESQRNFVNTRLKNIKSQGIKRSQRELDELRTIYVKNSGLTLDSGSSTTYEKYYTLPSNYLFLISDRSNISYCNSEYTNTQNRLYSSELIGEILRSTHTRSHYKSPVSELINNQLIVYLDYNLSFTINSVNIDYIRKYSEINLFNGTTSELDDSTHNDIVEGAVNLFLEAVESRRFRTNTEKNAISTQLNT